MTDSQDELLAREDGRYFAIDSLGTGLGSVATTERLARSLVSFGLPSGPALWLHIARRAHQLVKDIDPMTTLFIAHQQGIWPGDQSALFDFLEDCAVHLVFSFTAIEAFANEVIPNSFVYSVIIDGEEKKFDRADIERRISLDDKLHNILPQIFSQPSPKGTQIWQRYRDMKKIRDRIVHLKAVDRHASGPEDRTLWGDLIRGHRVPYCDHAHAIIGHYITVDRRWFREYPYAD